MAVGGAGNGDEADLCCCLGDGGAGANGVVGDCMSEALACREAWGVVSALFWDETGAFAETGKFPSTDCGSRCARDSEASVCWGRWIFGATVV